MVACRNPECVKGLTPGVVIRGKGSAKLPVLGQTMSWGWVRCMACNLDEEAAKKGVAYKHVQRSPEEIAQRAALATARAPYKPESAVAKSLGKVATTSTGAVLGGSTASAPATAEISKLTESINKLTEQVSELLAENRELRKKLDAQANGVNIPTPPRHEMGT